MVSRIIRWTSSLVTGCGPSGFCDGRFTCCPLSAIPNGRLGISSVVSEIGCDVIESTRERRLVDSIWANDAYEDAVELVADFHSRIQKPIQHHSSHTVG